MISDDYIMGFVEGEGCFSIGIQKMIDRKPRKGRTKAVWKKPSLGFRVSPSFRVTAVEDEIGLLYAFKERFGIGGVYTNRSRSSPNSKPASQYYAQSISDCLKIAEFFKDKEFRTSKGKSFQLWVQGLELIRQGKHLTKDGLLEICRLRDKMNPKLGGKVSRNEELIAQLLDLKLEHIEAHVDKQTRSRKKLNYSLHNKSLLKLHGWYIKRQGKHKVEQIIEVSEPVTPELPKLPQTPL